MTSPSTTEATDYTEDAIQLHQGVDHVRIRPAMYIGDVHERGLHHLVSEVVDNSIDEAMAGYCSRVEVSLHEDGSITIQDDGRGIPVGIHKDVGKPAVEVCLTELGGGGKFEKGSYQVSGGLHGVGVSCVNALSEWLEVEVFREGKRHFMRFEQGRTAKPLEVLGDTDQRGTKITFKPDPSIFKAVVDFKFETLAKRLKELAYLNRGLHVTLRDERDEGQVEEYEYANGIVDFVQELSSAETPLLRAPIYFSGTVESEESGGRVEAEVAVQYNDTYSDTLVSYANNINTAEGGTHLTGFRTALTTTLNGWIRDNEGAIKGIKGPDDRPVGDDYREGLVAVISVKIPQPQFEGQTKTKLGNSDVAGIVQSVVGEYLRAWAEQNPNDTKKIIQKALQARKARLEAKKAKELVRKTKDALRGGGIAKLKDAESKNPDECELYLVEGDSAGGTATSARDSYTQAILPLRGKILNVWKSTHEKMLSHNEISTIIQALGTGILEDFDLEKLQFHKIVIMCDADVDGSHIRTLILTFFFRQMPELIRQGKVFVAQPPLYKLAWKKKGGKKDEEEAEYFLTEEDFQRRTTELGLQGAGLRRVVEGRELTVEGDALRDLVGTLGEMNRVAAEIEKKDVSLEKYLRRRNEDGLLPYARVRFRQEGRKAEPLYTEEAFDNFVRAAREDGEKIWMSTDALDRRSEATIEITKFTGKKRLERCLRKLEGMGFSWEEFFPPQQGDDGEEEAPPPFEVTRDKDAEPIAALRELPAMIRTMAQKGFRVQRYKGLGEMDWQELQETTMDPASRQLLRVNLEDMAAAQSMFSTLMGSNVEQRRDFIEKHGAHVTNLDV